MSYRPVALTHRALLVAVGLAGAITVIGMVVLWPHGGVRKPPNSPVQHTRLANATLTAVTPVPGADPTDADPVDEPLPGALQVLVTARIDATGEVVTFQTSDETGGMYHAGQRVRLAVTKTKGQPTVYYISDFRREAPLLVLLALFLASVVAFGRRQGVQALLGLALSGVVIVGFIVPAILAGRGPVAVALVGSLLIMVVTLYLSHGWSPKTTAAVVGTAAALLLTAGLAALFVAAASITGFSSEDAFAANVQVGGLSMRGLLLAGVIIGGLGVLDDVTMSQSSTVFALRHANPAAGFAELVRGALSVGHDHITATVNTLFLAYVGASLPLLILFLTGTDPVGIIVTGETVAVEIVRALVGSIGLIAAVPLTTAIAAALAVVEPATAAAGHGHSHHHHGVRPAVRPRPSLRPPAVPTAATRPVSSPAPDADPAWEQRLRTAYRLPAADERS